MSFMQNTYNKRSELNVRMIIKEICETEKHLMLKVDYGSQKNNMIKM